MICSASFSVDCYNPPAEGYMNVLDGVKFNYVFNYTDHLGNIRVSSTQSGEELKILEESHYYPFGLKHSNYNNDRIQFEKDDNNNIFAVLRPVVRSDYQYKYNGKEFQDELGLDMYDYHARNYMPDIGRTTTYDPLAEKFYHLSPQSFLNNNPVYFIDPTGMEVISSNFGTTFEGADAAAAFQSIKDQMDSWDDGNKASTTDLDEEEDKDEGDSPMKDKLDKVIKFIGAETPLFNADRTPNTEAYNCHSYAWHNSMGDPKDPANKVLVALGIKKWDEDPYKNTGAYKRIPFNAKNLVGDRVVYYAWDVKSGKVVVTHSAVVNKVNSEGLAIQLISKLGEGPLVLHHPRNIPSIYGSANPTFLAPNGIEYQSRIYFRKK